MIGVAQKGDGCTVVLAITCWQLLISSTEYFEIINTYWFPIHPLSKCTFFWLVDNVYYVDKWCLS